MIWISSSQYYTSLERTIHLLSTSYYVFLNSETLVLYHRALQGGNLLAQFGDLAALIVLTAAKQRDGADHFRTEIGGSARIVDVQKILLRETALGDDHTECPGRIVAVFIGQSCLQLRIEGRQAFPICASALAMRSLAMCMSGLRARARSRA